jgi:erythromycin esterase-like protein
LNLRGADWLSGVLNQIGLEQAIGVIYLPESERVSHYFYARIADQFDAVIQPGPNTRRRTAERTSQWETGELPETYPFAV